MKPKFEIGDRVRYNELEGVIVGIDAESKRYSIQYEDDDDKYCVKEDWIEFANPRAAFLTRLQELLATFDAVINVGWNNGWQTDDAEYPLIDMDVVFKDGTGFCYDNVLGRSITAENVFDYDKD